LVFRLSPKESFRKPVTLDSFSCPEAILNKAVRRSRDGNDCM
jgi:hypothetical protein